MLNERDMQELSSLASKLQLEGYDVSTIRTILDADRAKINSQLVIDLTDYFPITANIAVRLADIEYGYRNLRLNTTVTLERTIGVFDKNSKPDSFESTLRNAVANCLKNIKAEYLNEVAKLVPSSGGGTSSIITASTSNPIILTIGSNSLYVEVGTIDTSIAWTITSITDSNGTSLDGTGTTTSATSANPITIILDDGTGNTVTFNAVSGSYDGSAISGASIVITGGI